MLTINEIRELIGMEPVVEVDIRSDDHNSVKKILPKNCTKCGAPTDSRRNKCAYCGCEY